VLNRLITSVLVAWICVTPCLAEAELNRPAVGAYLCGFDLLMGQPVSDLFLLANFNSDGTIIGSTLKDFGGSPFVFKNGPAYGEWELTGPKNGSMRVMFFNFDRVSEQLIAFSRIDATIEVVSPGTLALSAQEYFLPVRPWSGSSGDPLQTPGLKAFNFDMQCNRIGLP